VKHHRDSIERVAKALLERETLQGDEVDTLMGGRKVISNHVVSIPNLAPRSACRPGDALLCCKSAVDEVFHRQICRRPRRLCKRARHSQPARAFEDISVDP
jgi:hypothetical protein